MADKKKPSKTKKPKLTVEILSPSNVEKLTAEAKQIDGEIKVGLSAFQKNLSAIVKLVARIKNRDLWKYLVDPETGHEFKRFHAYYKSRFGPLARGKLQEFIAMATLTEGPDALEDHVVDAIGQKRSYELAKVPPHKRKRLVKSALESDADQFATDVCNVLNEDLPPEQHREPTKLFARNYPLSVIKRFTELEARAMGMEFIRDSDFSISQQAKFLVAMCAFFEAGHVEELEEADKYLARKAKEEQKLAARKSISLQVLEKQLADAARLERDS